MSRIAFTTYQLVPQLNRDDQLAADILAARGIKVDAVPWDTPNTLWNQYDLVINRSTWDYHAHLPEFTHWLTERLNDGSKFWNHPEVILQNLNKQYLLDFCRQGIEIVPTYFATQGSVTTLQQIRDQNQWQNLVIKPAKSAGGIGAWSSKSVNPALEEKQFSQQLQTADLLVQPYVQEVIDEGEWSLIFYLDEFSHAVLKRPAQGEFRVQSEYGGHDIPVDPQPEIIAQARAVLRQIDSPLLYARVDGVIVQGKFLLMELEINEPLLFMTNSQAGPENFARAIESVLNHS